MVLFSGFLECFGLAFSWVLKPVQRASHTHHGECCEGSPRRLTVFSFLKQQKGPRSDNSKSNKIFVGGIPHNCGETELREYFKKFGVVSCPCPRARRVRVGVVEPDVRGGQAWQLSPLGLCLPQSKPESRRGFTAFLGRRKLSRPISWKALWVGCERRGVKR